MTAPYLVHTRDYIDDEEGPKSSFYAFMIKAKYLDSRSRMLFAVLFSFVVAAAMYGPIASLSLITTTLLFGHLAGGYAERILGGVMGDFLGATICLSEVVVLVLLLIIQQNEGLIGSIDLSFLFGVPKSGETTVPSFEIGRGLAVVFDQCDYFVWVRLLVLICANIMWRTWVETSTVPTENGLENGTKDDPQEANPGAFTDPVDRKSCEIFSSPESTFVERFDAAMAYIDTLAKPVGSLGTLEIWASRLAALQRTMQPKINGIACLIFAGDHGVAAAPTEGGEGCSAYPQSVTKAILEGLRREVAGASVLAKANDIHLRVVDVGVIGEASKDNEFVVTSETKLLGGTGNFCIQPAMSAEECDRCIDNGRKYLTQYLSETSANVIALGEVGIGNTTSSSALLAALTGIGASEVDCLCDEGAYASKESTDAVVSRKISIVKKAMKKHYYKDMKPEVALATFGGAEISAMVGAILEASKNSVPVLLDGFIATAAALVAVHISPDVCRVLFFTTMSAEKGHKIAIEKIQTIAKKNNVIPDDKPVLSMGLRMGEGTAAILAAPILRSSVSILTEMATVQSILSLA